MLMSLWEVELGVKFCDHYCLHFVSQATVKWTRRVSGKYQHASHWVQSCTNLFSWPAPQIRAHLLTWFQSQQIRKVVIIFLSEDSPTIKWAILFMIDIKYRNRWHLHLGVIFSLLQISLYLPYIPLASFVFDASWNYFFSSYWTSALQGLG